MVTEQPQQTEMVQCITGKPNSCTLTITYIRM